MRRGFLRTSPLSSCSFRPMSQHPVTVCTSWTLLDGPVQGVVCVIDVLRWSSVVVEALANGAERIEAFAEPGEAIARARALGAAALAVGERHARPLPGFALGNSLAEYSAEAVQGKVLCSSTTNGTRALLAASAAEWVLVGSFLNFGATAGALGALLARGLPVTLLAAGQAGEETLEDTACAGAFVEWLVAAPLVARESLDKSARRALDVWAAQGRSPAQVFAASPHAQVLRAAGYERDLVAAGAVNRYALVARARGNVVQRATQLDASR